MAATWPTERLAARPEATLARTMTPEMLTSTRELNSRTNDGIRVRLLWCKGNGRVFVAVTDHKTGEAFSVDVPDAKRALEVYNHPYVYAT
jgi:hypothetical protein